MAALVPGRHEKNSAKIILIRDKSHPEFDQKEIQDRASKIETVPKNWDCPEKWGLPRKMGLSRKN